MLRKEEYEVCAQDFSEWRRVFQNLVKVKVAKKEQEVESTGKSFGCAVVFMRREGDKDNSLKSSPD